MRAAVIRSYGGPEVVQVRELPRPEVGRGQVLVRVAAAAVTSGDARIRAARFPPGFGPFARLAFGVLRPRRSVLGSAFSGVVGAVGSGVVDLVVGERVCGMTGIRMAAHAEYLVAGADRVTSVPAAVSHEDAAGVLFGGTTALHFLRDRAGVGPGTTVLVNGASGAVGTNAVQLATHLGGRVTGVCSASNRDLVLGLGAERVIAHDVDEVMQAGRFDVVLDAVGNLTIASGRQLLAPGGVVALTVAGLGQTLRARGDVVAGSAPERVPDYELLLGLIAAGTLRVVTERVVALDDVVEAYRLVDSGRKRGNVLVRP